MSTDRDCLTQELTLLNHHTMLLKRYLSSETEPKEGEMEMALVSVRNMADIIRVRTARMLKEIRL